MRQALAIVVALAVGLAAVPFVGVAQAQQQPAPSAPAPAQPTQQQQGRTLGNLLDMMVGNASLLEQVLTRNDLRQLLQNRVAGSNRINVVRLNNTLDRNELTAIDALIDSSQTLQQGINTVQRVVRNDAQLQRYLQQNNIPLNQVVAIDLTGQPLTLFVFNSNMQQMQPGTQQTQPQAQPQTPASGANSPQQQSARPRG